MPSRRARNKRWAELIYRIDEVDPLTCTQCGGEMKILAFITEHDSSTTETKTRQSPELLLRKHCTN